MLKYFAVLLVATMPLAAFAQNCESVIALSKTTSALVSGQSNFQQEASNFCKEYSSAKQAGASMSAGGSYGLFSASVGMNNQSAEAIASKYCSASDSSTASQSAYRSYVESISPNAYEAYARCVDFSTGSLKFGVDSGSILPAEFTVSASYTSPNQASKESRLEITPSTGVECNHIGVPTKLIVIPTGASASITCKRTNTAAPGYVKFVNASSSRLNDYLTLPWPAYAADGNPVPSLQALQKQLTRSEERRVGKEC